MFADRGGILINARTRTRVRGNYAREHGKIFSHTHAGIAGNGRGRTHGKYTNVITSLWERVAGIEKGRCCYFNKINRKCANLTCSHYELPLNNRVYLTTDGVSVGYTGLFILVVIAVVGHALLIINMYFC